MSLTSTLPPLTNAPLLTECLQHTCILHTGPTVAWSLLSIAAAMAYLLNCWSLRAGAGVCGKGEVGSGLLVQG